MFLTEDELKILTAYIRPTAQIKWLQKNHLNFFLDAAGKPKVLKEQIADVLLKKNNRTPKNSQPNFQQLQTLISKQSRHYAQA